MQKTKRIILWVLLTTLILLGIYSYPYLEGSFESRNHEDWMSELDPNVKLFDLYLPGSHDSLAYASDFPFASRTQSLNLKQQLELGVRYFDLRIDCANNQAIHVHGPLKCRKKAFGPVLNFEDSLSTMQEFLKNHPSETILVNCAIKDQALALSKQTLSKFDVVDVITDDTTLKDLQGKLVVLKRGYQEEDSDQNTCSWKDQKDTTYQEPLYQKGSFSNQPMLVQDHFCYEIEDKKQAIQQAQLYHDFTLNFLSSKGSGKIGHPYHYAKEINPWFLNEDLSLYGPSIFVFDFVNPDNVEHIIQANHLS